MPFIIHRKPPYRLYIEEGQGAAMAHVAELPGCFAVGTDAARVAAAAPRAIADFLAWLKGHREPLVPEAHVARPTMADLFVAEIRKGGAPTSAGSRAALFDFDQVAWDDERVERTLRWLGYSRADLLSRIEGFGDEQLKGTKLTPDRTLWDTLRHVANAEYGYINRIAGPLESVEPVSDEEPSDVKERLAAIRDLFVRRVRSVPAEKRGAVIYPAWAARPDEPWTLAKALRRALEHEREHLLEIISLRPGY
jgi:predicted RNase H-like HicB family nuclease